MMGAGWMLSIKCYGVQKRTAYIFLEVREASQQGDFEK